ncbi:MULTISPECIES: glycerol-3-phosphate dehydrogenase/oxidase [Niallia]|uniref:Glycerol-3-phosphate dehydrogenase n=1 Tax=Niallia circulans TaxID=1397 RepID=A0A941GEL0_NIACI|nr:MULTISPECIES: glycerol-3-phosphate dehydrogenase/oxidase [Niallia]MCB5239066.1 glycerol-3-phosphate dehydrogenase/oxidase [Niallia circulans]MED3792548.1 glycerol-3-phosphate dehydrogenase/oxidase [Niallia alba]
MQKKPSSREKIEELLRNKKFDVLVIGGGITGSGIALDAATRGMEVALVEMQDFSAGTSSRSTKLVHGGLRYLKQFEVRMVAEVGKEREVVYENGPHVTTPEWMLLPIYQDGTFGKFSTNIGLRVYDFLAGVKKSERRKMLSKDETLSKEPLIKKDGLKGGGYYVEYRTDDSRLTVEVMKKAVENGAATINYTKVENFLYDKNGKVEGVEVRNLITDIVYPIYADVIVNATGPWVDTLRTIDGSRKGKTLQLTKGVHLVINESVFPLKQAIYFDTPDGRMIFAIPRDGKTYVGTTDTFYSDDPIHPSMSEEDRDYLLGAIKFMFPSVSVSAEDVESSWAGVRPLILEDGKDPSEISRKDEIWESESKLITIAGGKLTGYRKMSETVVNLVAVRLEENTGKTYKKCMTKSLPISGGDVGGSSGYSTYIKDVVSKGVEAGLAKVDAEKIAKLYGSNAPILYELAKESLAKNEELSPVLLARILYAIEYEFAMTPTDVLLRRTGMLLFDIDKVKEVKESVINYMADYYNWNDERINTLTVELEAEIHKATVPFEG